jgi:hypothetical protein
MGTSLRREERTDKDTNTRCGFATFIVRVPAAFSYCRKQELQEEFRHALHHG